MKDCNLWLAGEAMAELCREFGRLEHRVPGTVTGNELEQGDLPRIAFWGLGAHLSSRS
jgi:hypothetical protein